MPMPSAQATGRLGSSATPSPPEGFSGFSPEDEVGRYTLTGAASPAQVIGVWVTGIARVKGDVVTDAGKRWRAVQAMSIAQNAAAPSEGAFWTNVEGVGRKSLVEPKTNTAETVRLYR